MTRPTISSDHSIYLHKFLLDTINTDIHNANDLSHFNISRINDKELTEVLDKVNLELDGSDNWKWDSVLSTALPDLRKCLRYEMRKRNG